MRAFIYNTAGGEISRVAEVSHPEHLSIQCQEGEDYFLNADSYPGATHIVDNEPQNLEDSLARAKEQKYREIQLHRDHAEMSGFSHNGNTFDSDAASLRRLSIAILAAQCVGPSFTIDWTCADNSVATLAYEDVLSLPGAMALAGDALHQKARALKTQLAAAQTEADVSTITW